MPEQRKNILVVDDEQSIVELLKKRLEKEYNITTAFDGQDGLNKARAEKPDLIVADVMMPRLDGYHMCRLLKFDANYKDIPIIMITSRRTEQDKVNAENVKADALLTKPFKGEDLMENIRKLLGSDK
jgi:DNA-binding response OmpR family regulator